MDPLWIVPLDIQDEILLDGQRRYPEEACGLLFGTFDGRRGTIERYLSVSNHAEAPQHAFELDPAVWVRSCFDPQLLGVYHTHPGTPPLPSPEDLRQLPNFAARVKLYLIGGRPAPTKKPPGKPDGLILQAYGIDAQDGGYVLRPIKIRESSDGR